MEKDELNDEGEMADYFRLHDTIEPIDLSSSDDDDTNSKEIIAINLRIDYIYRGKELENMCLYDYVSTIHKIKITDKELDKLARQENRGGRVTKID
ncbi:37270_t:CDS:2 [Gigaspora margarita]|uniref:37270_t:CDS:1 n=1 Tax=Gigaspora margarita TaxID=4874 RepID=A0ABM8W320_GIGMA|nr:37270_t:CDS:2 [Gigaspora margarita]